MWLHLMQQILHLTCQVLWPLWVKRSERLWHFPPVHLCCLPDLWCFGLPYLLTKSAEGFFFCCFLSKPTAVRQPLPVFCCPHLSSVNFRSYIYSSCSVIWFSFCFSPPLIVDINSRQSPTHLALVFWTNSCLPEGLLWISAWWSQVEANTVSENTTFQGAGRVDCCDKKGLRVFHV